MKGAVKKYVCRLSEKNNVDLKIYVKVSNFVQILQFSHFPKKLGNIDTILVFTVEFGFTMS